MSFSLIDQNGSPNIPLIVVGIALVGFIAWQFFGQRSGTGAQPIPNPETFATKFSNLPGKIEAFINNIVSYYALAPVNGTYNGAPAGFIISQIPAGNDYQGVLFASSDGSINIYTTYYEFLNWQMTSAQGVLSVPSRTLSNGVITDDATGGYAISGVTGQPIMTSLTGEITASLTDVVNCPITYLPTI